MNQKADLIIATRKSPLAMTQAEWVRKQLLEVHPGLSVELLGMVTEGDHFLNQSGKQWGGKGLFVKELEQALLDGRAHMAVHSAKDMLPECHSELCTPTICDRIFPEDVLVASSGLTLETLPKDAVIGTSSIRRASQILQKRPDLNLIPLRGNIHTRLDKWSQGTYDAIVLARAGLMRMDLKAVITQIFDPKDFVPAVGQGALAIQCLNDRTMIELVEPLNDVSAHECVSVEREFSHYLQGGCQMPMGAYAIKHQDDMILYGYIGQPDGRQFVKGELRKPLNEIQGMGEQLVKRLLAEGGSAILEAFQATA